MEETMKGAAILSMLLGVAATCGSASALEYRPVEYNGVRFLIVQGPFLPNEDVSLFSKAIQSSGAGVVTFDSGGGSTHAAMQIGRIIRAFGLYTYQERKMECASACSLAFLGGKVRFAEPGSIGVHRSSFSAGDALNRDDAVSVIQESTANILTYLREMGVDAGLLEFALRYDQSDIRYLSASEMRDLNVTNYAPDQPSNAAPQQNTPAPAPQIQIAPPEVSSAPTDLKQLETAALAFVKNLVEKHGYDPKEALSDVLAHYDMTVLYYGKRTPIADVIADKQSYFRRWPQRTYDIREPSLTVACDSYTCNVTGIYDWAVRSPDRNKASRGAAKFSYIIALGKRPRVIGETSENLGRPVQSSIRTSPLRPKPPSKWKICKTVRGEYQVLREKVCPTQ